jgi:hypothetical protein
MITELEGTQTATDRYMVTARPAYGREVTLHVVPQPSPRGMKFVVSRDPDRLGFISKHPTFEAAVKSSTFRAKRYLRAYSKPHGLAAKVAAS